MSKSVQLDRKAMSQLIAVMSEVKRKTVLFSERLV